jgi:Tol biopolymer transport system component
VSNVDLHWDSGPRERPVEYPDEIFLLSRWKNLAFTRNIPDTGQDIWVLPLDTTDPEHPRPGKPQLFVQTPHADIAPAFSPDIKWIAHGSSESGRFEVYVRPFPAPVDGSASPKWQISVNGGNRPAWSRTAPELFFTAPDNRIMVARFKSADPVQIHQLFERVSPPIPEHLSHSRAT